MWFIKVLKGSKAGETFPLKMGDNLIGRGVHCDICIPTAGISKEHAKVTVNDSGIYITDLNSTNGTFVNGIKIQRQKLRVSDKVTIFDVLFGFDRVYSEGSRASLPQAIYPTQGNQAMQFDMAQQPQNQSAPIASAKPTFFKMLQNYIEEVLLPGVYKLAEMVEFKWVMALLIMAFILTVTILSVLPMAELTKASIQQESQRRALSLARVLAEKYQQSIKDGVDATFSGASIEREEGVRSAYIISSTDGSVIAPASKAGQRPDEPFIHKARKEDQQIVAQIDDSTIGVSIPIKVFDSENGNFRITSDAVILYDMSSLSLDNGRTISLFVQVLAISLAVGSLLFFFLLKLMEHPLELMNKQIDQGLKDGQSQVQVSYIYPLLQDLITNVNTTLQRAAQSHGLKAVAVDRLSEASQLVENYPSAAMTIDKNLSITAINLLFEELVGLRLSQVQGQSYNQLNDQALILNLKEMLDQASAPGFTTASGPLEFSGRSYKLSVQPILSEQGISYYLVTLNRNSAGEF